MEGNIKKEDHRWNTIDFVKRTQQLNRTELFKLYPSEAWGLYRILPHCETVLDLGCGNGAMASIVKQISPQTKYTGIDHQEELMRMATDIFPYADFKAGNLLESLPTFPVFDAIMSWSVIKSFQNWREVIYYMIQKARKYVMFDIRVSNVEREIWDENICWQQYGNSRGPIILLNYKILKEGLLKNAGDLERIEFSAYQSGFGKVTQFSIAVPDQFIVSCVLKKKREENNLGSEECVVFEQLPGNLER